MGSVLLTWENRLLKNIIIFCTLEQFIYCANYLLFEKLKEVLYKIAWPFLLSCRQFFLTVRAFYAGAPWKLDSFTVFSSPSQDDDDDVFYYFLNLEVRKLSKSLCVCEAMEL